MLRAVPIRTPGQVERLRLLRNATREGYSGYTDTIGPEQQAQWWSQHVTARAIHAWLYEDPHGQVVGFGLLRRAAGRWWTTVGVDPAHRGHDYGRQITHDLVVRAPEPPRGVARRDNPAAVKLHAARDWDEIDGPDPALRYFQARRVWPEPEAVEQWSIAGWVTT